MGNDIKVTFDTERAFRVLDEADGKIDGTIQKNIWNAFASKEVANGRGINTNINKNRSIFSIETYFNRADETTKSAMIAHIDKLEKENAEKRTNAKQVSESNKTNNSVNKTTKNSKYSKYTMTEEQKQKIREDYPDECQMVEKLVEKLGPKNVNMDRLCVEFWAEKAGKLSREYGVSAEAVLSIIAKEVHFDEVPLRAESNQSRGPMQEMPVSVKDFYPGAPGNRYPSYKALDRKLLNDILYDKDGNLKYKSWKELWRSCHDDHELGIMVGILTFKAKQALAIESVITGKNEMNLMKAAKGIGAKWNDLTEEQRREALLNTFKRYNGSMRYAKDVLDSYELIGGKYEEIPALPKISIYDNQTVDWLIEPNRKTDINI